MTDSEIPEKYQQPFPVSFKVIGTGTGAIDIIEIVKSFGNNCVDYINDSGIIQHVLFFSLPQRWYYPDISSDTFPFRGSDLIPMQYGSAAGNF